MGLVHQCDPAAGQPLDDEHVTRLGNVVRLGFAHAVGDVADGLEDLGAAADVAHRQARPLREFIDCHAGISLCAIHHQ